MSKRPVSRNNILAGTFLIASLVLAVAASMWIAGLRERMTPTNPYTVTFTLVDGASGLEPGAQVQLGGHQVGRVTRVRIVSENEADPTPSGLEVDIRVRSDLLLYENAHAYLQMPLLGSVSRINILDPGNAAEVTTPQSGGPQLEPGEKLPGHLAPPAFLAQAGMGADQVATIRAMIDDAGEAAATLSDVAAKFEEYVEPNLEKATATLTDWRELSADIRQQYESWAGRVDSTLANVDDASAQFGPLVDEGRGIVTSIKEAIDENKPKFNTTLSNAESITTRFNDETMDQLAGTLASGQAGAEELAKLGEFAGTLMREEGPSLSRMVANFRLTSDQLKLTAIEVRRNPWRLFYQPKKKELEAELFYDAARTYAAAVSDLRAASESLGTLDVNEDDPQSLEAMRNRLADAFAAYEQAERSLLDRMGESP